MFLYEYNMCCAQCMFTYDLSITIFLDKMFTEK